MRKSNLLTLLLFGFTALTWGQTFTVTTVAGAAPTNATSVPGIVLYAPEAVWVDNAGVVYIADSGGRRVYKIDQASGKATAIVGNGQNANVDTSPTTASAGSLQIPSGLHGDAAGNLYIADRGTSRIKKITPDGKMYTIAGFGVPGSGNFNNANSVPGDGYVASNEKGTVANPSSTNSPRGMCVDKVTGNTLYWADTGSHRVRKMDLTTMMVSTVAGNSGTPTLVAGGPVPGDGGPATLARLNAPEDVSCGPDGTLYIADTGNHRIRKVSTNGIITTIAGVSKLTTSQQTVGGTSNSGTVVVTTTLTHNCTYSTTVNAATQPTTCGDGAQAVTAGFNSPSNLSFDGDNNLLYIADRYNNRIRKIDMASGVITTVTTAVNTPGRFDLGPKGRLFIPEMGTGTIGAGTNLVKIFDPINNTMSTYAGINHFAGEGTQATGALFNQPTGIAVDGSGNIYISDSGNHRVRKVDTTGMISTLIGTGVAGNNSVTSSKGQVTTTFSGDGAPGTGTRLNNPKGLAVDAAGNVYVADTGNHRILRWNAADSTTQTIVGVTGSASSNTNVTGADGVGRITNTTFGEGMPANVAKLSSPQGVALDGAGNIYIADTGNHVIRKVSADLSSVVTIAGQSAAIGGAYPAGTNYAGYAGDTGPATGALLSSPTNVAVTADGKTIIIADSGNNVVRRIVGNGGKIYTILGVGGQASSDTSADRPGYATRINQPTGVGIDNAGNIWVSDMNNGRVRLVDGKTLFVTYPLGNSGPSGAGSTSSTLIQATPPIGINWSADVVNSPTAAVRIAAPWGLAIGPDGSSVYVVDAGNGQVKKIAFNKP
jgi:sugar lactone lactonase YvrE